MPWQESCRVNLREEFVLEALEPGANISALCRRYGIARKTGYKWIQRFEESGRAGLEDLSRRPQRSPLRASGEATMRVVELRRSHPRWGPKKLHAVLSRTLRGEEVPSVRTVARIIERAGLVSPRKARVRRDVPSEAPGVVATACNEVWTVDFKGWWRTRDGSRAEPLTVRDAFSRYVFCAELMDSTAESGVRAVFERLFEQYGLPAHIHVDNGVPFVSVRSPAGLTRLSAWWVSLGIVVVRSRPGCPQDNGGHERMHLDMRYDVEDVAAHDLAGQLQALEAWRHDFNHVRPHEALSQRTPASVYRKSSRAYIGPRQHWYPPGVAVRKVSSAGYIRYAGSPHYVSQALTGHSVGVRQDSQDTATCLFYDLEVGKLKLTG